MNADIIRQNEEYRRRLESDFHTRKDELENQLASRRSELEREFAEKDEKFQAEKKALDDRSARHARRDQFHQLKTLIQSRNQDFALTKATTRKRWPTHFLFISLVASLGELVSVLAYQQLWLDKTDPYFGFRLPIAALGFVGALIYYIRWNDAWFLRHADEEFRLKRYDLDMDRAGWLVELAIEAYESGEEPVSEELLRRLSSNLFGAAEDSKPIRHPADDFRNALLEVAGEIEITVPGIGKVVLNRRQMQRLRRDIEQGKVRTNESEKSA